jgi:hypothetical protein
MNNKASALYECVYSNVIIFHDGQKGLTKWLHHHSWRDRRNTDDASRQKPKRILQVDNVS